MAVRQWLQLTPTDQLEELGSRSGLWWKHDDTVDGKNPAPVDRYISLSQYSQGFIHPRWFRISSTNSTIGLSFHQTSLRPDGSTNAYSNMPSPLRLGGNL